LVIAFATSQARKISTATKIWLAITAVFFVFSFFSQRYIIHAYPLILIAAAAYISDCLGAGLQFNLLRNKILQAGLAVIISGVFIILSINVYNRFKDICWAEDVYGKHYKAVARWMAENIPAGEVVFHANWSDSQYFIGLNPACDYFVTLDPMYMYYWNPKKYQLYRQVAFGTADDPYSVLKDVFKVKFGYASKNYFSGLINKIRQDSRFEVMAEDGIGLVFRLRPG
jgi:hypothetical protein